MKLLTIEIQGRPSRYLFYRGESLPTRLELTNNEATDNFTSMGSSHFFMTKDRKVIAKIQADKWSKRRNPIKWFMQNYIENRFLLQTDARKEFRSLSILNQAGINTPRLFGWGVSLNPANSWPSLLLLEYMSHSQPGKHYFETLSETDKDLFLDKLSEQLASLIQKGYIPRDLHFNNLLIDQAGTITWIDTHLKKIKTDKSNCKEKLTASLSERKLLGQVYKDSLIEKTCEILKKREIQ